MIREEKEVQSKSISGHFLETRGKVYELIKTF